MIEVELDFKDMSSLEELILYTRKKLGLPYENRKGNLDAFKDDFWRLRIAEFEEYHQKRDEWIDEEEYEDYIREDASYGLKNDKGVRDDLLLIFINFQDFFLKHTSHARAFLEVIFSVIEETKNIGVYEDKSDILDIKILIST